MSVGLIVLAGALWTTFVPEPERETLEEPEAVDPVVVRRPDAAPTPEVERAAVPRLVDDSKTVSYCASAQMWPRALAVVRQMAPLTDDMDDAVLMAALADVEPCAVVRAAHDVTQCGSDDDCEYAQDCLQELVGRVRVLVDSAVTSAVAVAGATMDDVALDDVVSVPVVSVDGVGEEQLAAGLDLAPMPALPMTAEDPVAQTPERTDIDETSWGEVDAVPDVPLGGLF